jgi:uncharacterized membrane protein YphA (DoxX/SURF4 family)
VSTGQARSQARRSARPGSRPYTRRRGARPDGRAAAAPASRPGPPPRRNPLERASRLAGEWAPTVARILLGLVLAWFGYHELVRPSLWTGYVPVAPASSGAAVVLVLAHGWLLLVLAAALIAGIGTRAAAAAAAVLLLEIVAGLTVTGGLSDLTLRDVGVLGLAICLTGHTRQRLVLSG